MKILQESHIVIENDKGEMIAVARRNGHIIFHRTPLMTVDNVVTLLESLAEQGHDILSSTKEPKV